MANKTKFKVEIHQSHSDNDSVFRAIGNVNAGKAVLTLADIQSWVYFRKAEWAGISEKYHALKDEENDKKLLISYDNCKTWALTIEEIEVHELEETQEEIEERLTEKIDNLLKTHNTK